jgi:hypothetical protein
VAIASILSQLQDGVEKPIAFASRQLKKAEQSYAASEVGLGNKILSLPSLWEKSPSQN